MSIRPTAITIVFALLSLSALADDKKKPSPVTGANARPVAAADNPAPAAAPKPAARKRATPAPAPAASEGAKTVVCSYYAVRYNGRKTASGQRFNSSALTAAHMSLPMGTRVRLTNPTNKRSVVVKVNDRGPYVAGRDISVTRRAAQTLGFIKQGVANVEMEVLN